MRKLFVFTVVVFLIGLHFYGKPIKFDRTTAFPSIAGIVFRNPFKKPTQIPIPKRDTEKREIAVSPSDQKLVDDLS